VDNWSNLIIPLVILIFAIIVVARSVVFVPQSRMRIVERLGKYRRTLDPGPHLVIPGMDKVRYTVDIREQVVSFPPQPVITKDNLVVSIDTVIYYVVTDPVAATYAVNNYLQAIEQLTMTQLRQVIGGMDLETTLTSRERINGALASELDAATGKWGIKVKRVELKGIDPPGSIQDSMEKQMRAERDKRAAVLTAEGVRQSAVLTADGEKQAAILRAEGEREAQILRAQAGREADILRAQGEAQAINTVFTAIHAGRPDAELLSYQYLQMLPEIAKGSANKLWIVPSELGKALEGIGGAIGGVARQAASDQQAAEDAAAKAQPEVDWDARAKEALANMPAPALESGDRAVDAANETVREAIAVAEQSSRLTGAHPGISAAPSSNGGSDAGADQVAGGAWSEPPTDSDGGARS